MNGDHKQIPQQGRVPHGVKRFYTALLTLPWLTSKIRNPVMAELGLNPRQQKEGIALAETLMMQAQVDAGKRDGRHASVVKTLADERKDEVAALHQRLYRARDGITVIASDGDGGYLVSRDGNMLAGPFPTDAEAWRWLEKDIDDEKTLRSLEAFE